MFTVNKYNPATNELTVTYKLSEPRKPEAGKVMYMCGSTGGFTEVKGVLIDGCQLKISTNIGFKK